MGVKHSQVYLTERKLCFITETKLFCECFRLLQQQKHAQQCTGLENNSLSLIALTYLRAGEIEN